MKTVRNTTLALAAAAGLGLAATTLAADAPHGTGCQEEQHASGEQHRGMQRHGMRGMHKKEKQESQDEHKHS